MEASDTGYWIGFPLPPRPRVADEPWRPIIWSLTLAAVLFLAAFGFARYLARPLRELNAAVERVGRGESPPPLPESGPSEIASLSRAVNGMAANLHQLEQDRIVRALLLTGDEPPQADILAEHPGLVAARGDKTSLAALPTKSDTIYLIDPLGNLVLRYSDDPDIKRLAKDLERVLRASNVG